MAARQYRPARAILSRAAAAVAASRLASRRVPRWPLPRIADIVPSFRTKTDGFPDEHDGNPDDGEGGRQQRPDLARQAVRRPPDAARRCQVLMAEQEPGVWLVRTATVVPDNERWLDQPEAAADLERALDWASANPPDDAHADRVLTRLTGDDG
jgi:hypothetical protein